MNRRTFLCGLTLGAVAAPLAAEAQGKVPLVGFLDPHSPSVAAPYHDAFRQGLREHGYVDGQNIKIEYRWAEGKDEQLPDLAAELVRLQVNVMVTGGPQATRAATGATRGIPIVMVAVGANPIKMRLVASLARPGGNVTGSTLLSPELSAKRLQLLKELVPKLARVAVLWNSANPAKHQDWEETQVAARALGVIVQSVEVQRPEQFEPADAAITRDRPDALVVLDDSLMFRHRKRIAEFAAKNRLPTVCASKEYADAGSLMSYSSNLLDDFRRAATYVDKILKGAKPADLPVEQPTKFELVINMKTAKALGLTIPQTLLLRADQLIE